MTVVVQSLLQLPSFFEYITQVGVSLSKNWVLLDGKCTELRRPKVANNGCGKSNNSAWVVR